MDADRVVSEKTAHANRRFPGTGNAVHSTAAGAARGE
jgi:hypothetical protein